MRIGSWSQLANWVEYIEGRINRVFASSNITVAPIAPTINLAAGAHVSPGRSPCLNYSAATTGVRVLIDVPQFPLPGDLLIVKAIGPGGGTPVQINPAGSGGTASFEDPGNSGTYVTSIVSVAGTGGAVAWWQYDNVNNRWNEIV